MRYWELQSSIKQKGPAPIYLVVGEEDYLRDQALALIKSAILGEAGSDGFNYDLFYGGEHPMTDVLACASEIPVFAERRLVVLKWAEKVSPREGEILLPYLQAPCETTTLVLLAVKLDRRMKCSQALSQRAAVVECAPPREGQLAAWVREEAGRLGVRLQNEAIAMLKETAAGSLYSALRELEKLAAYLPSGAIASPSDVEALRGTEPGASVFDLTAAIGARDRARVLGILARNLEAGEAPLRILGSLVWQYRRLWKMKELTRQGGRDGEAARNLRMEPYRVRAFLGQFPEAHLRIAFESFLETDSKLKGGSAGSGGRILEALVLGLCERGQRVRSEH